MDRKYQKILMQSQKFSQMYMPSLLLCFNNSNINKRHSTKSILYNSAKKKLLSNYANGSRVEMLCEIKSGEYFKITLESLFPRLRNDNVQWRPIHTNISNIFCGLLIVARDTSAVLNDAKSLLTLNNVSMGGSPTTTGDLTTFENVIHSLDKKRFPLSPILLEGEYFTIRFANISDLAFYLILRKITRPYMGLLQEWILKTEYLLFSVLLTGVCGTVDKDCNSAPRLFEEFKTGPNSFKVFPILKEN